MHRRNARYVKSTKEPTLRCHLEIGIGSDDVEGGVLNKAILGGIYRGYMEEHRSHLKANIFRRALKRAETFVRHEVHEIDPHAFPPLDEVVFVAEGRLDNHYVELAYKNACIDGVKRAEADAKRWNGLKEIGNIYLPVPLGLVAFFSGVVTGTDGVAWAAAAEFGPYLGIPPAMWFKSREHKLRKEIEELEKTKMNGELEKKITRMEQYNTAKDVCSFWVPVTFDGTLTGLSYSHMISTPVAYMTGIVAVPYVAHGIGAFSMVKEYAAEEKGAVLRKMMDTPIRVLQSSY